MLRVLLPSFAVPWRGAEPGGILLPALASPASPNPLQPLKSPNLKGEAEGKGRMDPGAARPSGAGEGSGGHRGQRCPRPCPGGAGKNRSFLASQGEAGADALRALRSEELLCIPRQAASGMKVRESKSNRLGKPTSGSGGSAARNQLC